jgi:serine/threonine-protein kinase RsbT
MRFPISSFADVERAWRRGLALALAMGFQPADASQVAAVISELGRNIERYAGPGSIMPVLRNGEHKCIRIIAQVQGPGIPDVERVLAGGHSISKGLGLGISGPRRLMDEFELRSVVGEGTKIEAVKFLHGDPLPANGPRERDGQ